MVEQTEQEIINGTASSANFMKSVGALVVRQGMYQAAFCSGTLVAQNLVLTAGHCLEKVTPAQTSFYVGQQANGPIASTTYPAKAFVFHPSYVKNATPPGTLSDYYDIALVKLAKLVPNMPAKMIRKVEIGSLLKLGEKTLLMGYGRTNAADSKSTGTKMQGFSLLKMIGSSELWLENAKGSQKCFGDSGGPTLMKSYSNGKLEWHVVGVASRTGKDCTYGSVETRVDKYLDWIHKYGSIPCGSGNAKACSGSVKKDGGTTPPKLDKGVTPTGKALGEPCSSGSECKSTLCIHNSGKNLCSQYCDVDKNNCPGKWICQPLAGSAKGACIKPDPTQPDPDAAPPPPKKKFGDPCLFHSDCESGICGSSDGQRFCTKLCTPAGGECGENMECASAGGGKFACIPKAKTDPPDPVDDSGCSLAGTRGGGGLALLLFGLLLLGRRRRA